MLGGIPKPLDLALFAEEFEDEVQGAFPPRWLQRLVLAPLAWLAGRRARRTPDSRSAGRFARIGVPRSRSWAGSASSTC